jgi:O-antigen ligase
MNRARLDEWCEKGIFVLICAALTFGPLATGAVRAMDFVVIQGLIVAALFLWTVRLWLGRATRLLWLPLNWVVFAFVGYAVVRYQYADIEYVARLELIKVVVYAAAFFLILNNLHQQDRARWVMWGLVFLGTAISMYAVYQFATGSDRVWHFIKPSYRNRASGTYINPNHLAGFLGMVLPIALSYSLIGRLSHVARILLGYASLVMVVGIGVTISRGGWIASGLALVSLSVVLIQRREFRIAALVVCAALSVGVVSFGSRSPHIQRRFEQIFKAGEEGTDSRQWMWRAAYQMWRDHPWFGVGPAHYDYRFGAYRPHRAEFQMRPDRAHNDYINTLADWGIVGTTIVLSAWAIFFVGVLKSWKYVRRDSNDLSARTSNRAALVLGGATGLIAILVHSFTDFNMHIPANAMAVVTLMALVSSHVRFATERYWVSLGAVARVFMTAILLVAGSYMVNEAIKRVNEERGLCEAARAEKYSPEQAKLLMRAYAAEPMNPDTVYRIGEVLRLQAWTGNLGYEKQLGEAMDWFKLGMQLNPYDALNFLRYGMCLHWLGRHSEANTFFQHAVQLEPNFYYVLALMGWHYVQLGDYTTARIWLERSLQMENVHNQIARSYWGIVNRKLSEQLAK